MKKLCINILLLIILCSCGAGKAASNNIVLVPTFNYMPGNKTATYVSVGGGESVIAEIDTGSEMTVINESYVGSNIVKTTESLTIVYGAGTNTVSGYVAYGVVEFTTSDGSKLSTSNQTPILVVESGNVNQGGGNNAILGMRMNNQISSRLFLPYPYNQMMVLNRSKNFIAFGKLNQAQLSSFAMINQIESLCQNLIHLASASNNLCWIPESSSTTYTYSLSVGSSGESNYTTLFDSGEANGNIYITPMPFWIESNNEGVIENQLSAVLNTSKGPLPMPMTIPMQYKPALTPPGIINPGNLIFNKYQILFDQNSGEIGFAESAGNWL